MNKVLVLGGYGGFGGRLSRRLAEQGWRVLVAGRDAEAGRAFCAQVSGTEAVVVDRNAPLAPVFAELLPDLVIDAAGPFQSSGYQVPDACIEAGISYIDLADARSFVTGIRTLDQRAKEAGVFVIAGASSVPALSGAVIRELAGSMSDVRSVDVAISASNRATAGPSVAAAILSYVGKPVRLWRGRRWVEATGWHLLQRETYSINGVNPLTRLTALADVPDHDIVPSDVAGEPATTFRAGPEFAFQLLAVWLLSWPVKWGWLRSLSPMSNSLRYLQGLTAGFGSNRSAMSVTVGGIEHGRPMVRRWTLIADNGDGPEIPTMAAVLLTDMARQNILPCGAMHGGSLLSLEQFKPLFDDLAIRHAITELACLPLYSRVMGSDFEMLPGSVKALHTVIGDAGAQGTATILRGRSVLARLVCALMGFPSSGETKLHVWLSERNGVERWTRSFGVNTFSSELYQRGRRLIERFGPLRFTFDLPGSPDGLKMIMKGWSIFHIPLPLILAPRCRASEWEEDGTFCFEVELAFLWHAKIIRYTGRLQADGA
jgi:hypothetical protein